HQAHVPSHVYTISNVTFTSPSFTHPRIGVEDLRICVESTLAASSSQDPRIGVEVHAYAWKAHSSHFPESRLAKPKRDQDFSKPKSATHRRRSPRICVGSQQLTFEAYVGRAKRDPILASPFQSHAYAQNSKHMRERQAQFPSSSRPTYMRRSKHMRGRCSSPA
ncbi:hypothetical protein PIB30_107876, partial [Stylosanthes scabra]|nr:hypothetical protein [Stylosanthes scabra]